MQKLTWDQNGSRVYETGTDHGVLYLQGSEGALQKGVALNGLTKVSEAPEGAEETALYADNFKGTIEACTTIYELYI